ncbi:transcriptional regulator, TetR family [Acidovorax delafieldii 2AN]|uniref:Transcriptional regulator, TetR family n=1 Tax=Acidovorax delafieldii 2AN TaxID=573060 RepID=C5T0A9_ACIDE|nr:TetR/AcrR family transcriptional regulator [Acidovorax delafieldii]EER62062.1 transcriptional regulator, TetR family [Acidovorax delafieldii 2AN]
MATHKNSQETVEKIVSAARRLFAKKGYANASLEDIAKLAGFTKGAIYHFFRSKESLLLAILVDMGERSIGQTARVMQSTNVCAFEKLLLFNRLQAEWAARNPDDLAILMWVSIESANQKSAVRAQVRSIYSRIEEVLESTLEKGKESGEFPGILQVKETVLWIIAIHDGNMLLWYRSGRDKNVGRNLAQASRQAMAYAVGVQDPHACVPAS